MIEDVYLSCANRGANPKAIRLWYKLNMNTQIQVRTGAGMSEYADVGAVVGQGTIGGALICFTVIIFLIMTCYQLHAPFSGSNHTHSV